ncbi:hypothetical protein [Asticcacaulis sp.]|uniref:hypothetical protein n=1 Tax=Asticcacaulis sp. TaxID=1872648 RepID=UPI002CCF7063|nr:hypothetical protein [Asticcacaulis sp.]HTM83217.1 hypothetical protein [Asticcacaulis sp.]
MTDQNTNTCSCLTACTCGADCSCANCKPLNGCGAPTYECGPGCVCTPQVNCQTA